MYVVYVWCALVLLFYANWSCQTKPPIRWSCCLCPLLSCPVVCKENKTKKRFPIPKSKSEVLCAVPAKPDWLILGVILFTNKRESTQTVQESLSSSLTATQNGGHIDVLMGSWVVVMDPVTFRTPPYSRGRRIPPTLLMFLYAEQTRMYPPDGREMCDLLLHKVLCNIQSTKYF